MTVKIVTTYNDTLVAAFARLIPQLSDTAAPPSEEMLRCIIASPDTTLFVADDEDSVVGTLTLAIYPAPTGCKAWIEDVVVDTSARGGGIGKALVTQAIATAKERGAHSVNLTSNPSRTAAHKLYAECGFSTYDTTLFRLKL